MDKNDNQPNGMRGDDDERSQGGSGDEDVFIQAAALAGELNNDTVAGKYQIVDEGGPTGVRNCLCDNFRVKLLVFFQRKVRHRMSRRHHGKPTGDDRHHRKGIDNPSFQHDEGQHGIERITSPKRGRKTRSSIDFPLLSSTSIFSYLCSNLSGVSPTKKARSSKTRTHSELRHLNSHMRSPQQQDMSMLTTTQAAGASAMHRSSSRHQRRTHYNKKLQKKNSLDANFRRRVEKLKEATSSAELDMKLLDKKMTKVLFNMHGVPVGPNVL